MEEAEAIDVIKIKGEEYFLIPKRYYNKDQLYKATDKSEAYKAIDVLTIGEYEAAKVIFKDIKINNCIVNLSKIADQNSMTKTLVTGTLRKLKIAGIIETSLRGPQGIDLTVLNEEFLKIIQES